MKRILKITEILAMALFFVLISCDENEFLKEDPLAIYTVDNSLVTASDFQAVVNMLYKRIGEIFIYSTSDGFFALYHGTDLGYCTAAFDRLNTYKATMVPENALLSHIWNNAFFMVNQANLIINRIDKTAISAADKNVLRGEALFFRAFAYRVLANLFGGVPIITEEINVPRRDFVRASRVETYTQAKNNLVDAIPLLGNIDAVKDGKISKQMAQHLLSEIYITLGDYDNAITQASAVISYPAMKLMTQRFGSKLSQPGDVYSDLFKTGNQNRKSGNQESLWVIQYDYLNQATLANDSWPWKFNPFYQNISVTAGGKTTTAFVGVTAEKGGRSVAWMHPTEHVMSGIWASDLNDMRISQYNIVRDFKIDNPASPAYGKWFVADGYAGKATARQWFPFVMMKLAGDIPQDFWVKDANGNPKLTAFGEHLVTNNGNSSFRDMYMFRLAETYLLRAEAYLGKTNKASAAADINVVRARAQAKPATTAEVDIDYLLDERLRELYFEEPRMLTLCRMGKLVERNRKYNVSYTDVTGTYECAGTSIQDYHNLWPIPFSEIERNIDAKLEQNPGYN
jgi:starch-binding outer membrane protein, SusD/RagB family